MNFSIDGTPVNSRPDWEHLPLPPAGQGTRIEVFPGIAQRFPVDGGDLPGGFVVAGFLEQTAADLPTAVLALIDQLTTLGSMRSDGDTHSILIHGRTYTECKLVNLEVIGPLQGVRPSGTVKVRRAVRFTWLETQFFGA